MASNLNPESILSVLENVCWTAVERMEKDKLILTAANGLMAENMGPDGEPSQDLVLNTLYREFNGNVEEVKDYLIRYGLGGITDSDADAAISDFLNRNPFPG